MNIPDPDSNSAVFKRAAKDIWRIRLFYILLLGVVCACVERRYGPLGWFLNISFYILLMITIRMDRIRRERRETIEDDEKDGMEGFALDDDEAVTVKKQGFLSWLPYFFVFFGAMGVYQGIKMWRGIKSFVQ